MKFSFLAMWTNKCPRCRKGNIYKTPFVLTNPLDMVEKCQFCGQKTEPEPMFYYGAMFMSYILSAWFLLLPALFLVFYLKWSVEGAMGFTILLFAFSYLKFLRGSRSLWLHMMVRYDQDLVGKIEMQKPSNAETVSSWKKHYNNQ